MLGDRLDRAERPLEHLAEHVLALRLLHRQLAGHHLVEDAAEEVDVGAGIALGAVAGALERRVIDGALALDARLGFVPLHRGQAEIDQLGLARLEIRMLVPLMSRWVTPRSSEYLQPLGHPQHERHGLLGRDPRAQLHEIAEVHPLDVFHDHVVPILLPPHVDDLDDVGMAQPHAGLGLLVKPIDGLGNHGEPLPQHLDRQGCLGRDVLAAIDPGEGPLRQVEEHLGIAEEKPAGVALLEPVDLPARERTLCAAASASTVSGDPSSASAVASRSCSRETRPSIMT